MVQTAFPRNRNDLNDVTEFGILQPRKFSTVLKINVTFTKDLTKNFSASLRQGKLG